MVGEGVGEGLGRGWARVGEGSAFYTSKTLVWTKKLLSLD